MFLRRRNVPPDGMGGFKARGMVVMCTMMCNAVVSIVVMREVVPAAVFIVVVMMRHVMAFRLMWSQMTCLPC